MKSTLYWALISFSSWIGVIYALYALLFPKRRGWSIYENIEKPLITFVLNSGIIFGILIVVFGWGYVLISKLG